MRFVQFARASECHSWNKQSDPDDGAPYPEPFDKLPMRVFFDTEFTGLTSDPRLLSIGLVTECGKALYIELTDGWSEENCSPWVREHVLPTLGKGERLKRRETGARILSWLSFSVVRPTLLGETDWDTTLLAGLMDECGIAREHYSLVMLAYDSKAQAIAFEEAKQRYFELEKVQPHHALNDAHAFRAAWNAVFAVTPARDDN